MTGQHVGIVGIGYAGLPLAVELARAGSRVTGFDTSAGRVAAVNSHHSPVDTATDEQIRSLADKLEASTDPAVLSTCSVIVVCVPTPVEGDKPDVRPLLGATQTVRDHLRPGQLVSIGSTTHPGTTDGLLLPILQETGLRVGEDFNLAYSPPNA